MTLRLTLLLACIVARNGGGFAPLQARAQANHVSSVQAMVIEKADKILAEKSRYAGQAAGAGGRGVRRNSEPGLEAHSSSGGVGVVKLDLDKLRCGAGVGGDKGADVQASRQYGCGED